MQKKKDPIKIIKNYPKNLSKDTKTIEDARKRVEELYGNSQQVVKKKRFNPFVLIPVAIVFALIISLPFLITDNQPKYLNIGKVKRNVTESVQAYNTENGTDYLFLSSEMVLAGETQMAVAEEDGQFAYLWQSLIMLNGENVDTVDFYASPKNVVCEDFNSFDLITEKVDYNNLSFYCVENYNEILARYTTMARFEYNNAKYYLKIDSTVSGMFYTYIDQLFIDAQ